MGPATGPERRSRSGQCLCSFIRGSSPCEDPTVCRGQAKADARIFQLRVIFPFSRKTSIGNSRLTEVRQISTNGGKGATKIGLRQGDHAIAYTSAVPPPLLPEERYLNKDPIRINPVNQTEKLDALSRINLGKVYPVEHNVKVCNVGMVDSADIRKLTRYYKTGLRNDLKG